MNIKTIKEHFSIIPDERQGAKVDYPLFDILFGSICAAGQEYERQMNACEQLVRS